MKWKLSYEQKQQRPAEEKTGGREMARNGNWKFKRGDKKRKKVKKRVLKESEKEKVVGNWHSRKSESKGTSQSEQKN